MLPLCKDHLSKDVFVISNAVQFTKLIKHL